MQTTAKQRILFVITKGNWGGAQRYVFDLATNISKDLFTTTVALGNGSLLKEALEKSGIPVIEFPYWKRDIHLFDEIRSFFSLIKLFRTEKPTIVHLNSSKIGGLGSLAARIAGVPKIIFTAHGWPFGEKRNSLARAILWLASWVTALLSHTVICVSEYDLKQVQSMPCINKKALRIYNGIKPEKLEPGDIIRKKFPTGARITGTIGELNKNKNQQALLEKAYKTPDMYVAIVGEGEERKNLEKKIKEYHLENRVKLFGFLPSSLVLKGFDQFVLPSLKEGLPYVLLEAKHAGLPIEANRVGGVGEILDKEISEFSLENMIQKTTDVYLSKPISDQ